MATTSPSNALPPQYKLGDYVIQSVLGQGGFGITYLGLDTKLGSQVAIKEYFPQAFCLRSESAAILPLANASASTVEDYRWGLQEFLKEARALAQFKHNHIARVLRFLEANDTAYMVMEYEAGESLGDYLGKHGGFLDEPMLLRVFLPILSGLQAVHDTGLLHLDIKPENIYLRTNGQPMLIDFGSARQAQLSQGGQQKVALTPGFAALEQYPNQGDVGSWSDVYSVGATLYRCITGKQPLDAMARHTAIKRSTIDPLTPAVKFERPFYSPHIRACVDLAIKLSAQERPQSAFALQQGLMGKNISEARPVSQSIYRFGTGFVGIIKAVTPGKRGRKYSAFEKSVAFLVFLATIVVVTPKILVDTYTITEAELYDRIDTTQAALLAAATEFGQTINERVFNVRRAAPSRAPTRPARTAVANEKPIPLFEPVKTLTQTLAGHAGQIAALAFLEDGAALVSTADDGAVKLWDIDTGQLRRTLPVKLATAGYLAASADGNWLAMAGEDNAVSLWDIRADRPAGRLTGHTDGINALAFSPDGKILASASRDRTLVLWDMEQQKILHQFRALGRHTLAVAFSPNGRTLAAGDQDGGIRYIETATFKELAYSPAHPVAVTALAFSPDGNWLASGGMNGFLKLWRTRADTPDLTLADAPEIVHAVAFSPDSKWLMVTGNDGTARIWETATGKLIHQVPGPQRQIYTVAISPDGQRYALGGDDPLVRVWQ
jgi:serine/threonine protein kinase